MNSIDLREAVLTAAASTDPVAALETLGRTLAWTTAALAATESDGAEADISSLAQVLALDDALEQLDAFVEQAEAAVRRARLGAEADEHLKAGLARLRSVDAEIDQARARYAEIAPQEEALRRRGAEHDDLTQRVDGLQLLQRRAAEIPQLEAEERALTARLGAMRSRIPAADAALLATAGAVITLREEVMADLSQELRSVLTRTATVEADYASERSRHADALRQLGGAVERFDELHRLREDVAALEEYIKADREMAAALASVTDREVSVDGQGVTSLLEELQTRLLAVDRALGRALTVHQEAQDRARRALRYGAGAEPAP